MSEHPSCYRDSSLPVSSPKQLQAVFLDFDSNMVQGVIDPSVCATADVLRGAEGMDFMAFQKGLSVEVQQITEKCMRSGYGFPDSLRRRLDMIRPTQQDVAATADEYKRSLLDGGHVLIEALKGLGMEVFVVSGGIRQAILPIAKSIGILEENVHAVELEFDQDGEYAGVVPSHLANAEDGKSDTIKDILASKGIPLSRVAMVGDGGTDMRTKSTLGISTVLHGQVSYRQGLVDRYKPDWVVLPGMPNQAPTLAPVLLTLTTTAQQGALLQSEHASSVKVALASFVNYRSLVDPESSINYVIRRMAI